MLLRLTLIIPSIGEIRGEIRAPYQAGAGHAQPVEIGIGQIAHIQPQPLCLAAVFDYKLQQDEALTRITVARARIEMYVQLLIRFDKPEVVEAGGMGEAHAGCDLLPAWINGQIGIRTVLVREDRIRAVGRQRMIEIIFDGSVEVELTLSTNCIVV